MVEQLAFNQLVVGSIPTGLTNSQHKPFNVSWENPPALSVPRCLVVSPDREFAYLLAGIVSRHGIDVEIGSEVFAALRMLRTEPFDLFLYDVSSDTEDHDMIFDTLQRDLPRMIDRTVVLTKRNFDASRLPAGVAIVGNSDLAPLMRYTNE